MAKKKNSVSINALEKHYKFIAPDIVQLNFEVGTGETVDFEVKPRLSLEECMRYIEDVVSECVNEEDLLYIPMAHEFVNARNVLTYYANFTMPADLNKAFELVSASKSIVENILEHVDKEQYEMIQRAITKRIDFEKQKMITLQEVKVNGMMAEMNQFISRMSGLFEGVDGDQMAKFVSGITQASQITAQDLANAMVGSVSKTE